MATVIATGSSDEDEISTRQNSTEITSSFSETTTAGLSTGYVTLPDMTCEIQNIFMVLTVIPSSLQLVLYVEEGQAGCRLNMGFIIMSRAVTFYVTTDNAHVKYVLQFSLALGI